MIYIFPFIGALVLYFILPLLPIALTKKARYIVILNTLLLTLLYLALVNLGSIWVAIFAVCTLLPLTAYLFFTRVILAHENQTDDVGPQIEKHDIERVDTIENEVELNYVDEVEVEAAQQELESEELEELEEETFLQKEVNLDLSDEIPVLEDLVEIPKEDITEELVEDEINEVSNSSEEDSESEDEFDFLLRKREVPKKREVVDLTDDSEVEQLFGNREQLFLEVEEEGILLKEEQEGIPLAIDVPSIAKNVVETEEKNEESVINPNQDTIEEIDDLVNVETIDATEEEIEVLEELRHEEDSEVKFETRTNEELEKLEDIATADETDIVKSSSSRGTEFEEKRMDSGILSLVLKELTWIKKLNGEESYEHTLLGNLQNKLHPRDHYLFASLLRDLYISQQDDAKLENLMLDLRERYIHQPVLLEEINYYLNQIK